MTRNLLADAGYVAASYPPASLARFGADTLGRAIGHELMHDGSNPADWAALIRDIRQSGVFTVSQQVLMHQSMIGILGA